MTDPNPTELGQAVTALILDVFRLNGRLQISGDRLVGDLGLTSARWQILGAIALAPELESVAWHAREMGVHRQGVQRIVNELEKEGVVQFAPNPKHKRAQLVGLTPQGQDLFKAAMALQIPWVNDLAEGLKPGDLAITQDVIAKLTERLQAQLTS